MIVLFGTLEMIRLRRLEEVAQFACGLFLIASPFGFGYADMGRLATWHFVLGAVVILLAVFELWQDWGLTAEIWRTTGTEAQTVSLENRPDGHEVSKCGKRGRGGLEISIASRLR